MESPQQLGAWQGVVYCYPVFAITPSLSGNLDTHEGVVIVQYDNGDFKWAPFLCS